MNMCLNKRGVAIIFTLVILFALLIFIEIASSQEINKDKITGESVSGKAVTQQTTLSIVIDALPPNVTISSPQNRTYNYPYISLNFTAKDSVSSVSSMWYNLNGGSNTTITGNTTIYANDEQTNILRFYTNDSFNFVNTTTVIFFVNSSHGWQMNYTNYYGGNSTNLSYYQQLGKYYMQNISNFTLENLTYGKVKFNVGVNLSKDINFDDEAIFKITGNLIFLNSSYLSELNQSATLSFYNLAFSNPRMLIDGEVCPVTICSKNSYSNGILSFNVTHFSEYSSEETPATPPTTPSTTTTGGSSGGGGSVTSPAVKKYTISNENYKIKIKQGQTDSKTIIIKNTGTATLKFSIKLEKIENLIRLSETKFDLEGGKEKTINIDFLARKSTIPDLYLGKILVKEDGIAETKEILIAIEVESEKALFDVSAEIPKKYQVIDAGNELIANIKLFNLGGIGRIDVKIDYEIKDINDNIIYRNSETVAVETQVSLSKIIQIPEDTPEGYYVFYIKTTTPEEDVASATSWFSVGKVPIAKQSIFIYSALTFFFLLVILIIFEIRNIKKHLKSHKIDDKDLAKYGLIKKQKPEHIFAEAFKN